MTWKRMVSNSFPSLYCFWSEWVFLFFSATPPFLTAVEIKLENAENRYLISNTHRSQQHLKGEKGLMYMQFADRIKSHISTAALKGIYSSSFHMVPHI